MSETEEPFVPPLPDEAPPDDGWEALWDPNGQAYYFYNRFSGTTTWENPRVPEETPKESAPGTTTTSTRGASNPPPTIRSESNSSSSSPPPPRKPPVGGYNPKIHGDYNPSADYAQAYAAEEEQDNEPVSFTSTAMSASDLAGSAAAAAASSSSSSAAAAAADAYSASAHFNRFTGRFQDVAAQNAERHGDEAKARRQLHAFFDADAQANSHGGRSLKAERQGRKLTKEEVRAFNEKRKRKKEEKRRAFYRD